MAKSIILLALVLALAFVGVALSIPFNEKDLASEESLWSLYERWRSHHTLSRDLNEKNKRFNVFKENAKFIHEFNVKKDAPYKLGLNKFADMTNQEFRSTYAGSKIHHHRTQRGTPKARSCWAFSTIASVEGINKIKTNQLVPLSEQQLVDCDTDQNQGCDGGLMDYTFEFIKSNGGITSESAYPYTGEQRSCASESYAPVVTIDGYQDVPANNEAALKKAVANQVVSVAIEASGMAFQFYSKW